MKALFEKIVIEVQTLGTTLGTDALLAAIRQHFLDHTARDRLAATTLAANARERFEDAASRGFPNHNAVELKANAIAAQAHADSLDIAAVLLPKPVRGATAAAFDGGETHYVDTKYGESVPAHPAEPPVAEPIAAASGIVIPQLDETAGTATTGFLAGTATTGFLAETATTGFLAVSAAQADGDAETTPPPPVADGAITEPAPEAPEQTAALPEPAGE